MRAFLQLWLQKVVWLQSGLIAAVLLFGAVYLGFYPFASLKM